MSWLTGDVPCDDVVRSRRSVLAGPALAWFVAAFAGALGGCSTTGPGGGLPEIGSPAINPPASAGTSEGKPPAASPPSGEQVAAQPAAQPAGAIVGFRKSTVVLYESESSNNGRRVPSSSFSPPIRIKEGAAVGRRVPIATVDGLRWISRDDVTLH